MRILDIVAKLEPKDYLVVATASLAAVTSIGSLLTNLFAVSRAESRKSQREMLAPIASEMGELLHELMAASQVYLKRTANGQSVDKWREKAVAAAEKLKAVRRKAKYPLWGTDHALNVLGRLPSWIAHCRDREDQARRLVDAAEALRLTLDKTILASLRTGHPPGLWRRSVINFRVWRLRSIFGESEPEEAPEP